MDKMNKVRNRIIKCRNCDLYTDRINAVPGEGSVDAKVILIGEAPGKKEDEMGRPFVGRAGKTLDGILEELDVVRDQFFITNIVKCRPPKNRVPKKSEVEACRDHLIRQIDIIKPELIVALGQSSIKTLTGLKENLRDIHGQKLNFMDYQVLATYHPAAMVYNRKLRPELLNDLKQVKKYYE